jgi:hypothetical protein
VQQLESLATVKSRDDLEREEAWDSGGLDDVDGALSDRKHQSSQRPIDHPNPIESTAALELQ